MRTAATTSPSWPCPAAGTASCSRGEECDPAATPVDPCCGADRGLPRAAWGWAAAVAVVFFLPWVHGSLVLSGARVDAEHPAMDRGAVTVGMIQPNTDPWEKWTESGTSLIRRYFAMTNGLLDSSRGPRPAIVLWPETAMPYFILAPQNRSLLNEIRAQVAGLNVSLLTGLPQMVEYPDPAKAPAGAKRLRGTNERYDSFNAAAFIQPGVDSIPWYGKMKMVPLAERIPYADVFQAFDFLR